MRAHGARSGRRRAADARRRVRIRTSWLPGFPVDGRWQPFAPEVTADAPALVLGPDEIRRAERAPKDVPHDVAEKVVDDGWADTLRWIIGRAKEGALTGSAAERYRPTARKAFRAAPPALAEAISWWRLFAPAEAPEDLAVAAHPALAEILARHGVLRAMRLLRAERTIGLGEILGWLGDARSYRAPAMAIEGSDVTARRNSTRNGPAAAAWWTKHLDGATANQVRILAAAAPGEAVRDAWLADRAGYVDRLERIERCQIPRAAEVPPTSRSFPALAADMPLDCEHSEAFARGLRVLPDLDAFPRLELAARARSAKAMASATKALGAPFPWLSMGPHLDNWRVSETILYSDHPHDVAALLSEPCTPEDVDRASEAVDVAGPAAAALFAALPPGQPVHAAAHGFAVSVTTDPAALAALVAVIPSDFAHRMSKTLAHAGPAALTRWFADHHGRRLESLASLEPLARRPLPPPPDIEPVAWWTDLPAPFHGAAEALSRVDPDAEGTTRRVLRAVLPDAEAIGREVAWIDQQPADHERAPALAKRRAGLLRLLASPPAPSPRRVDNLLADLDRVTWDKRLERWEAYARDVTTPLLRARLGLAGEIGLLLDDRYARVLAGYDDLDGPFRKLFARVLRARLGPPPWDLPDPANERVARRFTDLGLDVRPWIARDLVTEGSMPEGATFRVRFEPDPLEVLRMGEHFGTCLSPGGVNWFSAVANAADWHRQVAFARDVDGTVLGRVLVCLTEQGGLLSFQLYAHRHEPALEEAMAAFVREVAARMGTAVVANGRVPLAVAPRWYDDGPADRTGTWPALDPDSEFRQALRTVAPSDLRSEVVKALAPAPPAPLVLGWLAGLPEVYERPDLLRALLPDADVLSDEDPGKIELYRRLFLAGEREHVVRWARTHAPAALRRRWADPFLDWLFDLAVEEFPGRVLQWARTLSPCSDCGYAYDGFSAYQAARACEALHRPHDAKWCANAAVGPDLHSALPFRFTEDAKRLAGAGSEGAT